MRFKGVKKTLPEIAKALKVDAVVQGSVIRSGDALHISAQLLHARTDTHLWAETYDRRFSDVLTIQSDIAQAIAQAIQVKLTNDERVRLADAQAVNPEAYEEYLKGRYHWNRRRSDDLRRASTHFERAIAIDPTMPLPYVGLADSHLNLVSYGLVAPRDGMPRMKAMLSKALELDPSLAQAHCSMGMALFYYDWSVPLAEQSFRRAIELDPLFPIARQWYALFLTGCGRFEEALAALAQARRLDPLSVAIPSHTAWTLYFARDYDGAIRACRHTFELQPDFHQALVFDGMAHERKGMFAEAVESLKKAVAVSGADETGMITLAHAYAGWGRLDRARELLGRVLDSSSRRYVSSYQIAALYVALNETSRAFEWLERGYTERNWYMSSLMFDPRFDPLRTDPRFVQLVRRIGTADPRALSAGG
jgi:tetratricopeptide (TPR) repeat protein